jgi:hypothetical protein
MPSIGPALRERLQQIARERARLDKMEAGIKALLQLENEDVGQSTNGNGAHADEAGNSQVSSFVLDVLKQKRAVTVNDLKTAATNAGIDFGEKSPGRVLHWTLVAKKAFWRC